MAKHPSTLVVVCHYNARPVGNLVRLLKSMQSHPAGSPFAVRIVVNAATATDLVLPAEVAPYEVVFRENTGYNIGAWDFGWRADPAFESYLFLQEECTVVRDNWLVAFLSRAAEPLCGLLGECLSVPWNEAWMLLAERTKADRFPEHLIDGQTRPRVECYLHFLSSQGIPAGPRADHLQSLILFARREILEAIDGFPTGRNYGEAIAAEIGISKKVQALGLNIAEVGPEPFYFIEHPDWLHRRSANPASFQLYQEKQ